MPAPALLNMFAAHTATGGSWAPDSISGLIGWYDSTVGVTSSGGDVSAWADQSGNARDLAWNSSYDHPTTGNTLNGDAVVSFDGNATMTASFGGISQPLTILALYVPTVNQPCRLFDSSGRVLFNPTSNVGSSNNFGYYAGSSGIDGSAITTTAAVVQTVIYDGSSSALRVNGASNATGNPGTNGMYDLYMGGFPSGDSRGFFVGDARAWFAYDSVLSGTDLTNAEDYLNALGGGIY